MSTKNLHIVQKQVIDFRFTNANALLDWEANKRSEMASMIKDQLEKCFDEWDKADDILVIDKLDIDLGILHSNTIQSEMPGRVYEELKKKLNHYTTAATKNGVHSSDIKNSQEQSGIQQMQKNSGDFTQTGILFSGQQGRLESLFYFLKRGFLPWWGSALADWDSNWIKQLSTSDISRFRSFLAAGDAGIIQRVVTQFDDDFIQGLLQRMEVAADARSAWNWLQEKIKILLKQEPPASTPEGSVFGNAFDPYKKSLNLSATRLKFWSGWIAHAVDKLPPPGLHKLFDDNIRILIKLFSVIETSAETDLIRFSEVPATWREELSAFRHQIEEKKSPEEENKLLVQDEVHIVKSKKKVDSQEEKDTMFVNDAGLTILHPFLPQLFRNCGWVDKNSFLNDYAQTMAVYALHYLATGNTKAMEYELVFPKLLTGMDWEQPLMPVEPLTDHEKAACDELLIEVLKYWEALRNTSPNGLREGFLQRTGKLEHIYSGWHLTIEQNTLDILLSRLPWGISVIKFTWMPQMLTVSWQ